MKILLLSSILLLSHKTFAIDIKESDFNELKNQYYGKLPDRIGQGEEVWDKVIAGTIQFKDEAMLKTVLGHYPELGMKFERHRMDVKALFDAMPSLTLKASSDLFEKNWDCLIYKIVPMNEQIKYQDIRGVLNQEIERLTKANQSTTLIMSFRNRADVYYKGLKAQKPKLTTANCIHNSTKNLKKK